MTGFGRAEHATNTLAARVEASSVNRKQGEIVVQLPRCYNELEAEIRKIALSKLSRGRVSISIQIEQAEGAASPIQINAQRARALETAFTELSEAIDRPLQPTSADFLRTPEILVFDQEQVSAEDAMAAIFPAVTEALDSMIAMRASEGQHLHDDTDARLNILEKISTEISSHAPSVVQHYREQLHRRLSEAS